MMQICMMIQMVAIQYIEIGYDHGQDIIPVHTVFHNIEVPQHAREVNHTFTWSTTKIPVLYCVAGLLLRAGAVQIAARSGVLNQDSGPGSRCRKQHVLLSG